MYLWDIRNQELPLQKIDCESKNSHVSQMAVTSQMLLVATNLGSLHFYDISTWKPLYIVQLSLNYVNAMEAAENSLFVSNLDVIHVLEFDSEMPNTPTKQKVKLPVKKYPNGYINAPKRK